MEIGKYRLKPGLAVLFMLTLLVLHSSLVITELFEYKETRSLIVYAPAVSSGGGGVLTKIQLVVAYPGSGRLFFSSLPYSEVETQGAARVAAFIASIIAGVDYEEYDYYVLIESSVPLIGGPSAGGLITVGFTALLLNTTILPNITMTGMINPDGTIGPVGGLKEKLEAATSAGFKVFLIPSGQRIYSYPVYVEERRGPLVIGRVRYESIDLVEYGKTLNVSVYEVSNILEALEYFTGLKFNIQTTMHSEIENTSELIVLAREYIGKTREVVENATILTRSLGLYGMQFQNYLRNVNSSLDNLEELVGSHPVYTVSKAIELYTYSLKLYWLLRVGSGENINRILGDVNKTLEEYIEKYERVECSLQDSFIQFYVYMAWLNYLKAVNSTDTTTIIDYVGDSIAYLEYIRLVGSITGSDIVFNCTQTTYTEIYSHILAVYTYGNRILEETSTSSYIEDHVSDYIEVLNYAYLNSKPAVIVASIFTLAGVSLEIHQAINDLNQLLEKLVPLEAFYSSNLNTNSGVLSFYTRLYREAIDIGDNSTAVKTLLVVIGTLELLRTLCIQKSIVFEIVEVKSQETTSTTTVINTPTPFNNTSSLDKEYSWILPIIQLALIISVFIIIIYILREHVVSKSGT